METQKEIEEILVGEYRVSVYCRNCPNLVEAKKYVLDWMKVKCLKNVPPLRKCIEEILGGK